MPDKRDPTNDACPDHRSDTWRAVREMMMQGGSTEDQVTQRLDAAWQASHQKELAEWQAHLQQHLQHQHQQAPGGQAGAAGEDGAVQRQQRKAKAVVFDTNAIIGNTLSAPIASSATTKLQNGQYVELDYFTRRGREATQQEYQGVSADSLGIVQLGPEQGGALVLRPIRAMRASKNIRQDSNLEWEDINRARHTMMQHIIDTPSEAWPTAVVESFNLFFSRLDRHTIREEPYGDQAVVRYAARVRKEWHDQQLRGVSFNIGKINEQLLKNLKDEIMHEVKANEIAQLRALRQQAEMEMEAVSLHLLSTRGRRSRSPGSDSDFESDEPEGKRQRTSAGYTLGRCSRSRSSTP
ncbi:hypothetical protein BKA70DRAFT_1245937 [Coprinopsis sp. MPI-PUGE-AT-0042]|nr:hypothetical protein BKA70DRAFT_1245937 [Coprinopsis sp. MPI-PUGE-AT-0042]